MAMIDGATFAAAAGSPHDPFPQAEGPRAARRTLTLDPARDRAAWSEPPPRQGGRIVRFSLSRRSAVPVAIGLSLLVSLGDAWTTAEAAFTLFYLLPIGIAVWFHGRRLGYLAVALCSAGALYTDLFASTRPLPPAFIAWNNGIEVGLFLLFLFLLDTLRARLEREVHLRHESVAELRHSARLNTVGKLAAGLAHELGTPLNVITGHADLVLSGRGDPREARASLGIILEQAGRMTAIIRGILDFSRRSGERTARTRLLTLCEETASVLRPLASRVAVTLDVGGDDIEAEVESAGIQQVLTNLITNAVHASRHGGAVEIRVTEARQPLGRDRTRCAVISVRDEGSGIPAAILPHVFDPFFTTKDVGEGTGLGLSIAYGIVRDHGGRIQVQTAVGEGTTFRVLLPI